ncbi:hypothetical protein OpiT1DRAFT_05663 [Opitutaceae bacterium TAV1]|nr:hypothetical protein OpiT1DRAFT_05663 [Opitutaceae bacterium TAV1]
MSTIDTSKWVVVDTPLPPRRSAAVQAAYDFFWKLELGKSALIPKDEAGTARNAAAQLKRDSEGNSEVRFRDEGDGAHIRATKIKDYTPEQKASLEAGQPLPESETSEDDAPGSE